MKITSKFTSVVFNYKQNQIVPALSKFSSYCENLLQRKMDDECATATPTGKRSEFIKEEEVARGKWLSLQNITYRDPTGRERLWESVQRTTTSSEGCDAVSIVAILKRVLKYDCVVLVKQYRPPMKGYTLEFPAGLIDPSETPEVCALRELKEETGYTGTVKHVSPVTCLDPGIGSTTMQLVTAEIDGDLEENKHPQTCPEDSEFIEVFNIPLDEFLEKLNEHAAAGTVVDARVYAFAVSMEMTKKTKHVFA